MNLLGQKSSLKGIFSIPPSKSHTIRAVAFALLAKGKSTIKNPLKAQDAYAALSAAKSLGAEIVKEKNVWKITGTNGIIKPKKKRINVQNSATTLRMMTSIAARSSKQTTFDGDNSLRTRPMRPLLKALTKMGATIDSTNGYAPLKIRGPINGANIEISATTSQYLSSLLMITPLLKAKSTITVLKLNEKQYVDMTLQWLDSQNIKYSKKNNEYTVQPNQSYTSFKTSIPGDWSSAAFPLAAAALTNSKLTLIGIQYDDVQGDKKIVMYLKKMGAKIDIKKDSITMYPSKLKGCDFDLNDTPDLLPIMSVVACGASGKTTLKNVAHARIKETDRIQVMYSQLKKLNANIQQRHDGLIIHKSALKAATVDGHHDHRIIMSLAIASLKIAKPIKIKNAQAIDVTFPDFVKNMNKCGASFQWK